MNKENDWEKHFSKAILNSENDKTFYTYSRETLMNAQPSVHSLSNLHTYDHSISENEIQNSLSNLSTQNGRVDFNNLARDNQQKNITSTANQYEIINVIGKGGMGIVYLAVEKKLGRHIAIKKISSGNIRPDDKNKFIAEARVHAFLEHPNIAPIYELGQTPQGDILLAMKLVGGSVWSKLLQQHKQNTQGQYSEESCLPHFKIWLDMANAVAFAHSKNIVHNDLKPDNIMVGDFNEVLLMDWGIAVDIGNKPLRAFPKETIKLPTGTMSYAPPELAMGKGSFIGVWTDIYLLGAILYQIIIHTPPHRGKTLQQVMVKAYESAPPPFSANVPIELQNICCKAMQRNPRERYSSVQEFIKDVNDYLDSRDSIRISENGWQVILDISEVNKQYDTLDNALEEFSAALKVDANNHYALLGKLETHYLYALLALKRKEYSLADEQIQKARLIAKSGNKLIDARKAKKNYMQKFTKEGSAKLMFKNLEDVQVLSDKITEQKQAFILDQKRKARYLQALYIAIAFIIVSLTTGIYLIRQKQLQVTLLQVQTDYEKDKESIASFQSQINETVAIIREVKSIKSSLKEINNRSLSLIATARLYTQDKDYLAAQKTLAKIDGSSVFSTSRQKLESLKISVVNKETTLQTKFFGIKHIQKKWQKNEIQQLLSTVINSYQSLKKEQRSFDYSRTFDANEKIQRHKQYILEYLILPNTITERKVIKLANNMAVADLYSPQYFPFVDDIRNAIDIYDEQQKVISIVHQNTVAAMTFSPNLRYFASIDKSGLAYIWNILSNKVIHINTGLDKARYIYISSDNQYIIVEKKRVTHAYSIETQQQVNDLVVKNEPAVNANGKWWLSNGKKPPILFITHKPSAKTYQVDYNVSEMMFAPTSNTVAIASFNKIVLAQPEFSKQQKITFKELCSFEKPNNAFSKNITWSSDEMLLAATGQNGDLDIWIVHREKQKLFHIFHTSKNSLGFIPIGIRFIPNSYQLQIWTKKSHRVYEIFPNIKRTFIKETPLPKYLKNSLFSIIQLTKNYGIKQGKMNCEFRFSNNGQEIAFGIGPACFLGNISSKSVDFNTVYPLLSQTDFHRNTSLHDISFSPDDNVLAIKLTREIFMWNLKKIRTYESNKQGIKKLLTGTGGLIEKFSAKHNRAVFIPQPHSKPALLYINRKHKKTTTPYYTRYPIIMRSYQINKVYFSDEFRYGCEVISETRDEERYVSRIKILKIDNFTKELVLKVSNPEWKGTSSKTFAVKFLNNNRDILFGSSKGEFLLWENWEQYTKLQGKDLNFKNYPNMLKTLPMKIDDPIKTISFEKETNTYWIITTNARIYVCYYDGTTTKPKPIELFPQYEKIGVAVSPDFNRVVFIQKDFTVFVFTLKSK
ncbi:protein kinase [Candidatus Uabimicrobium sp. HlEnr_7]|uniref:protein kinase domain-containing protein n=1 Tax=Candidatus Uabimicrobium helgolandensis TaxID=3095367 RepID=UPI0035564E98